MTMTLTFPTYQKATAVQATIEAAAAEQYAQFMCHEIDDPTLGKGVMYTPAASVLRVGSTIEIDDPNGYDWLPDGIGA